MASAIAVKDVVQHLTLPELRQQCRSRGLSPAGGLDALRQRLTEDMLATNDLSVRQAQASADDDVAGGGISKNNYNRPGGNQNLGNRITDRPSSKVLAPPGGASQLSFGDYNLPHQGIPPPNPNNEAHAQAQHMLAKMGLGNTDRLVAEALGRAPPSDAYATPSKSHNNAPSHLAFGDYRLPSTVQAEGPEEDHGRTPAEKVQSDMVNSIDAVVKPLMLKDLRAQCRLRGLSPAGGLEQLRLTLGQHMAQTGDLSLKVEGGPGAMPSGAGPQPAPPMAAYGGSQVESHMTNNYARPGGQQNVGNFITDRPSSKVLAPPGGGSQIMFGDYSLPQQGTTPQRLPGPPPAYTPGPAPYGTVPSPPPYGGQPQYDSPSKAPGYVAGSSTADVQAGRLANNYARPNGQQNVGNFITDRPSSRVLAPPGGKSQITFG